MKVLVTGGCGYKGSVLVPKLLAAGNEVTVFDTQWFGVNLPTHKNLRLIKGDVRSITPDSAQWIAGHEAVIHLAAIANDPCGDLDAKLTWEVNVLSTARLADACVRAGVQQFIFASSASLYGIKGGRPVREDDSFEPVSDYNRTKFCGERVLLSYADKFALQIARPATVSGVAPRMRLDTIINMLTMQALETGRITAHCGQFGKQLMRPHIHIEDVTNLYLWLLGRPHVTGPFNAGFTNMSVEALAEVIRGVVPETQVDYTEVVDKRSYAVDSSRLLSLGFVPRFSVPDAVEDIVAAYRAGELKRTPQSINLEWMRSQGIAK